MIRTKAIRIKRSFRKRCTIILPVNLNFFVRSLAVATALSALVKCMLIAKESRWLQYLSIVVNKNMRSFFSASLGIANCFGQDFLPVLPAIYALACSCS